MNSKGQIAIEFLLLTVLSMFFLVAILVILHEVSGQNMDIKREKTLDDLGITIRNELTLASEMEDGYHREINIPKKVNGQNYNLSIQAGASGTAYLVVSSTNYERYYSIPETFGTIKPGRILLEKNQNLTVTYLG